MIPIGTSYRLGRTPWVNYAIVVANVLIFVMGYHAANEAAYAKIRGYLLYPDAPQLHQFFSSMFLHGSLMHLIGNMVFLWVFGNAINDRLGHIGYLAFYLAGGVLAGIGYILLGGNAPVLGASGAIAAVTGAFLVLLPRTRVTILIIFYFILPVEISSLLFLAIQFLWNLWMSMDPYFTGVAGGGVAYSAHSTGYIFGIAVSVMLLATKVLPRDPFDLLNLIRSHRRRTRFRRMVSQGYDPFNYIDPNLRRDDGRRVETKVVQETATDTPAGRELALRKQISRLAAQHNIPEAAERYIELTELAPDAILSRQVMLDVANQFMSDNRYDSAAAAYEKFLKHYNNYEHEADIHLMLGITYGRYLGQNDRARRHLELAIQKLHDERKIRLAKADLEKL